MTVVGGRGMRAVIGVGNKTKKSLAKEMNALDKTWMKWWDKRNGGKKEKFWRKMRVNGRAKT
jgi:hypothetical protein